MLSGKMYIHASSTRIPREYMFTAKAQDLTDLDRQNRQIPQESVGLFGGADCYQ